SKQNLAGMWSRCFIVFPKLW
ncbi:hypothetical protein D046_8188, partial [Vibrio parahaemolyticus V-223/04]